MVQRKLPMLFLLTFLLCLYLAWDTEAQGNITFEENSPVLQTKPGEFMVLPFIIYNHGDSKLLCHLRLEIPEGWTLLEPPSSILLEANQDNLLFLVISTPLWAPAGQYLLKLHLVDHGDNILATSEAAIFIDQIRELLVSGPTKVDLSATRETTLFYKIQNRGNVSESLSFEIIPTVYRGDDMPISIHFNHEKVSLAPNDSMVLQIYAKPILTTTFVRGTKLIVRGKETKEILDEIPILFTFKGSNESEGMTSPHLLIPSLFEYEAFTGGSSGTRYAISGLKFLENSKGGQNPGRPQQTKLYYDFLFISDSLVPWNANVSRGSVVWESPNIKMRGNNNINSGDLLKVKGIGLDVTLYPPHGKHLKDWRLFGLSSYDAKYIGVSLSLSPVKGLSTHLTYTHALGSQSTIPYGSQVTLNLSLPNFRYASLSMALEGRRREEGRGHRFYSNLSYRNSGLYLSLQGSALSKGWIPHRLPGEIKEETLWNLTEKIEFSNGNALYSWVRSREKGVGRLPYHHISDTLKASFALKNELRLMANASFKRSTNVPSDIYQALGVELSGPIRYAGFQEHWSMGFEITRKAASQLLSPRIRGQFAFTPRQDITLDNITILEKSGDQLILDTSWGVLYRIGTNSKLFVDLNLMENFSSEERRDVSLGAQFVRFYNFSPHMDGRTFLNMALKNGHINWGALLGLSIQFDLPTPMVIGGKLVGRILRPQGAKDLEGIKVMVGTYTAELEEDGSFAYKALPLGEQKVKILNLPAGYIAQVPDAIQVNPGTNPLIEIPILRTAHVEGELFSNARLNAVRVLLKSKEDELVQETFTDDAGRFSFTEVLPGEYIIEVDMEWLPDGYVLPKSRTEVFSIAGGESPVFSIVVEKEEKEIRFASLPTEADFSWRPKRPVPGEKINFRNESTCDFRREIVSRQWSFGDGTFSTQENPSHIYSQAGEYVITLTIWDDAGDTSQVSQSIMVK